MACSDAGLWGSRSLLGEALIGNFLYYLAFVCLVIHGFLETTMFVVIWPVALFSSIKYSAIGLAGCKILFDVFEKDLNKLFLGGLALLVGAAVFAESTYGKVFIFILFVIGALDVDFRMIAKLYLLVSVGLFVMTLIACGAGLIENVSVPKNERYLSAYGFTYTTELSAHVTYMIFAFLIVWKERLGFLSYLATLLCALATYCLTEGRLALVISVVAVLGVAWVRRGGGKKGLKGPSKKILTASFVALAVLSVVFMAIYEDSGVMASLNRILTGRLYWAHTGFEDYGVGLFGRPIEMQGWGRGEDLAYEDYYYIDCSYVNILLRFGIISLLLVLIVFTKACLRASSGGNDVLLVLLAAVALSSFINEHLIDLAYNFFGLTMLSRISCTKS